MTNNLKIKQVTRQRCFLSITTPAWCEFQPLATQSLFEMLHYLILLQKTSHLKRQANLSIFSAEILANQKGLNFVWSAPDNQKDILKYLLQAYCPDFKIQTIKDYKWSKTNHWCLLNFNLSHDFDKSLKTLTSLKDYDPLSYLIASLVKLKKDEQICYQILISPYKKQKGNILNFNDDKISSKIFKNLKTVSNKIALGCLDLFQSHQSVLEKTDNHISETPKIKSPLFLTNLRILISSPSLTRLNQYKQFLSSSLGLFNNFLNQNLIMKSQTKKAHLLAFLNRQFTVKPKPFYLNATELSGLYHIPSLSRSSLESAPYFLNKTLPPNNNMKTQTKPHILLGENHHQEIVTPIGLNEIQRQRHLYIVGGTGMGKTTLLKYQIVQDIKAGRGIAVIDPHGDLAQELLDYIPNNRINDVIYFNPVDYEYPLGINLLQLPEDLKGDELEHAKDLRTEAMISVLRKVFHGHDEDAGHRIEYILRNTIQTSFSLYQPSLFTIFKLLNDRYYNLQVVKTLTNPYLKMFWQNEMNKAGAMQKVKMQAGVTAKIGRFIFSPSVAKVFNQTGEDCLNFANILNEKKILICNFAKGLLGEDTSSLFGAMILAQIQLTALEQINKSFNKRPSFYLYVDEFQNFATKSFVEMLSEARKYGLNLILAQQSTQQQTDRKLIEVILANVGSVMTFRTGSTVDAQILSAIFDPFIKALDINNLPAYNFYLKSNDINSQIPTSGITTVLDKKYYCGLRSKIIKASRKNWANKE